MKFLHTPLMGAMLLSTAILFSACSDDDDAQTPPAPTQQEVIDQMIGEVRALTADYHDHDAAMAAGWDIPMSECVAHPELGGMGYHFGKGEFLDGRVNHLEPQILLFAPNAEGEMEFVGVEYVVPFAILPADSDAPQLFFHHYHKNPVQEIWALHVWTEKHNPEGMFSDWNPDVSCN